MVVDFWWMPRQRQEPAISHKIIYVSLTIDLYKMSTTSEWESNYTFPFSEHFTALSCLMILNGTIWTYLHKILDDNEINITSFITKTYFVRWQKILRISAGNETLYISKDAKRNPHWFQVFEDAKKPKQVMRALFITQ